MSKIEDALRSLTLEQRALLERRLQRKRRQQTSEQLQIRPDTTRYPLTAGQRRILDLDRRHPNSLQHHFSIVFRLKGPVRATALNKSLRLLFERHEALRAQFTGVNEVWKQSLCAIPDRPLKKRTTEGLAQADRLSASLDALRREFRTPFELHAGPLLRSTLIRLADDDYVFGLTIHRVICDPQTLVVFLEELSACYRALVEQRLAYSSPLNIQFADFAAWQQSWLKGPEAQSHLTFWRDTFKAENDQQLLRSKRKGAKKKSERKTRTTIVPAALVASFEATIGQSARDTLSPYYLGAFKALLHHHTSRHESIVCLPTSLRVRDETRPLIGNFENRVASRTVLEGGESFNTLVQLIIQARETARPHRDYPFEKVAALPELRGTRLEDILFSYENAPGGTFQLPGVQVELLEWERAASASDLALFLEPDGEALAVSLQYNPHYYDEITISALLDHFLIILEKVSQDPRISLDSLLETPKEGKADSKDDDSTFLDGATAAPVSTSVVSLTVFDHPTTGDALPTVSTHWLPDAPLEAHVEEAEDAELEQILTRIWERNLGVNGIGPHDNFFELGGNTQLAVEMIAEIQRYAGQADLPLGALLESPTIASLAFRIREGTGLEWSPLVVIQPGRGSIPLFCIHAAEGNVQIYQHLAHQLGHEQTVYGLQSQGMDGLRPIIGRIEDMAQLYVRAVRQAFPHGPYLLAGYRMGGTIALEMAQILRKQGLEVALLAVFETYNWSHAPRMSLISHLVHEYQKLKFHIGNYLLLSGEDRKLFLAEKKNVLLRRLNVWYGKLRVTLRPHELVPSTLIGINHRAIAEVWRTNDLAAERYKPETYPDRLLHFRAREEYFSNLYPGMRLESIAYNVETHILSVYPAGMLIEPFVRELAQALRAEIYKIEGNEPRTTLPPKSKEVLQLTERKNP